MIFSKETTWKNAIPPLALCLLLLIVCCFPAVTSKVLALDYAAFYHLNPLIANSPLLDRLIRLFAAEEDRIRFLVPLFIGLGIYLYRAPDTLQRFRRIAFILFITIVLLLTMILEKQLDLLVNRHGPAFTVHSFENLREIYGWKDFSVKERHTFPSDEAVFMITWGLTLLGLKSRKWGTAAIALGMIASIFRCIAGTTWLSDIYLGALPMAFLIAVIATKTPFVELLPWLESTVITIIDQAQVLHRKASPVFQLRSWPFDLNQALHLEIAVKRYVRRNVPQALGFPPDTTPLNLAIEMPLYGMRSLVRKITVNDRNIILRVYPAHRHFEAHRYKAAADTLTNHGVRTPAVLQLKTDKRTRALFMLEEFVDGKYVRGSSMTDPELEAITDEYARMHSIRNKQWGPPDKIRLEDYFATILRRARRQLASTAASKITPGFRHEHKLVLDWLISWQPLFIQLQHFSLVHHNLHRENGLYMADGKYCLLDHSTLEWGVAAKDIALVHNTLCEGNPEIITRFNKSYYPKLPDDIRDTNKALSPFFDVLLMLNSMSRSLKRILDKKNNEVAIEKQIERWNKLLAITQNIKPQT